MALAAGGSAWSAGGGHRVGRQAARGRLLHFIHAQDGRPHHGVAPGGCSAGREPGALDPEYGLRGARSGCRYPERRGRARALGKGPAATVGANSPTRRWSGWRPRLAAELVESRRGSPAFDGQAEPLRKIARFIVGSIDPPFPLLPKGTRGAGRTGTEDRVTSMLERIDSPADIKLLRQDSSKPLRRRSEGHHRTCSANGDRPRRSAPWAHPRPALRHHAAGFKIIWDVGHQAYATS